MKNEKWEPITDKQINGIYWRGEMYFRMSKDAVMDQCMDIFHKPLQELTQHEATRYINLLINEWSKLKNDKARTSGSAVS